MRGHPPNLDFVGMTTHARGSLFLYMANTVWRMMSNEYLITIDIDWASDPIIKEVMSYLVKSRVKCTWFVTHDSPAIQELFDYPDLFEIGLHPNFSDNSTQGKTPREVMRFLREIAPEATTVRTHSLVQSAPLLQMMRKEFNVLYDVSLLLPFVPQLTPHDVFYPNNVSIKRFPYFWEDDEEMCRPDRNFLLLAPKYHAKGIKIFDFHPIHIVLNSYDMNRFYQYKSKVDLTKCSSADLKEFVNDSIPGAGTLFRELISLHKDNGSSGLTISDLARGSIDNK